MDYFPSVLGQGWGGGGGEGGIEGGLVSETKIYLGAVNQSILNTFTLLISLLTMQNIWLNILGGGGGGSSL